VAGDVADFIMPRYVNLALEGVGKNILENSNVIVA
jgi:hypothetical protein